MQLHHQVDEDYQSAAVKKSDAIASGAIVADDAGSIVDVVDVGAVGGAWPKASGLLRMQR